METNPKEWLRQQGWLVHPWKAGATQEQVCSWMESYTGELRERIKELERERDQANKLQSHFAKLAAERWNRIDELELKVACLQSSHSVAEKALQDKAAAEAEGKRLREALKASG